MAEFSKTPLLNSSSVHFDEEAIDRQKKCFPGPNVQFSKKVLPFSEYISNMLKPGSLGCNSDQYPKYKDGKYCCESEMATPQEEFDYVNNLLLSAINNVGQTAFRKYSGEINYLKKARNDLLAKYRGNNLRDILVEEFPININGEEYKDLDEYILKNTYNSNIDSRDMTNRDGQQGINSEPTKTNTFYNSSIGKKEGGKRRFCKGCRKTIKRRKSRKIGTNKKSKKSKRYTKK